MLDLQELGPDTRYHPRERCAWCGAHRRWERLRVVMFKLTHARALVCVDVIACCRRRGRRDRRAA